MSRLNGRVSPEMGKFLFQESMSAAEKTAICTALGAAPPVYLRSEAAGPPLYGVGFIGATRAVDTSGVVVDTGGNTLVTIVTDDVSFSDVNVIFALSYQNFLDGEVAKVISEALNTDEVFLSKYLAEYEADMLYIRLREGVVFSGSNFALQLTPALGDGAVIFDGVTDYTWEPELSPETPGSDTVIGHLCRVGDSSPYSWFIWDGEAWTAS